MNENNLNSVLPSEPNSFPLRLVGVGVFLWLCIKGYGYLVRTFVRDAGLLSGLDPLVIYWSKMVVSLVTIILFVFFLMARFQKAYHKNPNYLNSFFFRLVVLYVISQVIQFLYTYYIYQIVPLDFFDALFNYDTAIYDTTLMYQTIDTIPDLVLTVFCGVYLYKRDAVLQKKVKHV